MAGKQRTGTGKGSVHRPTPAAKLARARFAEADVSRCFETARMEKARALLAAGSVTAQGGPQGPQFQAVVVDSGRSHRVVVEVRAPADLPEFASSCSCRAVLCAHAAAAALLFHDQFPAMRRPTQVDFLDRLQIPPNEEKCRLVYGLEATEDDDGLFVTIVMETVRGNDRRMEICPPKRAAQSVPPGPKGEPDRLICRMLNFSSLPVVVISLEDDDAVEELISSLLETGRCRWGVNGPALLKGPTKRFLIEVNPRTSSRRFLNKAERIRLLYSDNPWYVNEVTGQIGHATLEEVLAPTFRPSPQSNRPNRKVEAPPHVLEVPPRPVLMAATGAGEACPESNGQPLDVLVLHFEYEGKLIREDDPSHIVRIDGESGPIYVKRDTRAEEEAAATLRDFGLTAVRIMGSTGGNGSKGYAFRSRNPRESWQWLVLSGADELKARGWRLETGDNFPYRIVDVAADWDLDILEGNNGWFSLDVGIEVEGQRVPLLPILLGIIERGGISQALTADGKVRAMLSDGRILALPVERVSKFLVTLEEMLDSGRVDRTGRLSLPSADVPALVDLESIVGMRWHGGERLRELGRRLREFRAPQRVEPPPTFHASLRGYQRDGLDWLQFLRCNGMGGILADDMGLGKTAQTLAHIAVEKAEGRMDRPCLIVVPTSLVPNWVAESNRFTPDLKVFVFHGLDRHERRGELEKSELVITTYAILARDGDFLSSMLWHLVALDEAQAIKNPMAKSTRAACRLKARNRLCLSGTPIENHLGEVWSQFTFLMPGMLGDHKSFTARFRTPIEKRGDESRRSQLARRLKPFVLRRTKVAVATELPPKTEIVQRVELASDQRDLYETIRLSMHEKVREEVARLGIARSRIVILDALLKLRQVCCDPRLVKLDSARRVTGSGKLEVLVDMIRDMVEEGRRILLFSQFTSMLDLIKQALVPTGITYVELRGDTADRASPVNRFQAGEAPLFLISLKAGGRGLNLTAADTVIHYDPWWNPAVENQATDRAYRIGQTKPVFVYKLIAAGTVEERIVELQARKGSLADAMLDEGTWTGALSDDDVDFLLAGPRD